MLRAASDFNVFWHDSPNDPYSYTVNFAVLQNSFTFTRPELFGATPSGLIVSPWRARAFCQSGCLLDTVSEPQLAFFGSTPAVSFTLTGPGITSVIFDRTTPNTVAGLNRVPTDDWIVDVPTDPRREIVVGSDLMFGNTVPGSIHGLKYEDMDGDGTYNPAVDLPLSGVDFTLTGTDGQGNVINTTETTDVNGEFWFTGLLPSVAGAGPGTGYTVTETLPRGFVATTPTSFTTDLLSREELVALPGQAMLPPATIVTVDFDALDASSVPPLEVLHGPQVDSYLASFGIFVGEAVRLPSGVPVPTVVGIVDQANESRYIAPSADNWFQIDDLLHRNEPFRYRLDFAEPLDRFTFTRAELSAPPNSASPWTATALDALGTPLDTTGEGFIGNSPAIVHTLDGPGIASVVFERTIVNTSAGTAYPATDDFVLEVPDPRREVVIGSDLMFGNTTPGSIHGFKYEDLDGDGVYNDLIDLPLAGVEITLTGTDGQGNVINTTETTDLNGEFSFNGLLPSVADAGPGTGYTVAETVPAGFVATTPISLTTDLFSREELVALPGQAMLPAVVSVTIDFDDVDASGGPDHRSRAGRLSG